jgi:hypothetical protein
VSQLADIQRNNERLQRQLDRAEVEIAHLRGRRDMTGADAEALDAARVRADGIAAMHGERAVLPNLGEEPLAYRNRLLKQFTKHSKDFKGENLVVASEATLKVVEDRVYHDAAEAARQHGRAGILVPETITDESGRKITKYHGDPMAWLQFFHTGAQVGHVVRPDPTKLG